jgi:hypothetical protein
LRVCIALLLLSAPGWAANAHLETGRRLQAQLSFREAIRELELARTSPSSPGELEQILDLLAQCNVAEGHPLEAIADYQALLSLNWAATVDAGLSPKILAAFAAAKRRVFPGDSVTLRASDPIRAMQADVVDPWARVDRVRFYTRSGDETSWSQTATPVKEHRADLPPADPTRPTRWYAEATAADGRVLATAASANDPLTLAPTAALPPTPPPVVVVADSPPVATAPSPSPQPLVEVAGSSGGARKWSWVPAVVGVAAAATGGGLLLQANNDYNALTPGAPISSPPEHYRDEGKAFQTAGAVLVISGAAALASAGVMYWLGGAEGRPSVSLAVDGRSARICFTGAWP